MFFTAAKYDVSSTVDMRNLRTVTDTLQYIAVGSPIKVAYNKIRNVIKCREDDAVGDEVKMSRRIDLPLNSITSRRFG